MALSRWSHSPFYIYEPCGGDRDEPCLTSMGDGYWYLSDILNDLDSIVKKMKEENPDLTKSSLKEFELYLKYWANFESYRTKFLDDRSQGKTCEDDESEFNKVWKKYCRKINLLRHLGAMKYLMKYSVIPWGWDKPHDPKYPNLTRPKNEVLPPSVVYENTVVRKKEEKERKKKKEK